MTRFVHPIQTHEEEEQKPETGRLAGLQRRVGSNWLDRKTLLEETVRVMRDKKTRFQK